MSSTLPPSVISHVSLGTNDYPRAKAFYDAVLATLQIRCVMDFPGAAGYGRAFPEFWVQTPHDGGRAGVGNGVHVAFLANSVEEVHAFHAQALALGATDDGAPGLAEAVVVAGADFFAERGVQDGVLVVHNGILQKS